jgi:DNA invertase Pin-like site-specific DNA recombinase
MLKYRAAVYLRLSYTDEKSVESDSISNQKKLINDFLSRNPEIEAISERIDDGFSGTNFERPSFKAMLSDIEAGKIDCVVTKDLSRLGRDYIDTGRYLRQVFPKYGIRFIAVNDNIDTIRDRCDDISISFKNIINDAYAHDISKKTRSALAVKRKNGDYVGACPIYGYVKSDENKNKLAVDEYAAGIVRDIFRMKIEGVSAAKIADNLNNMGILSPLEYKKENGLPYPKGGYADVADARWSATTVIRILKDETYTGVLIQGKSTTGNHKISKVTDKPADEWIRTEQAHDAVIRKHDFDLVQRIIRLDTRISPQGKEVYLFSGILICGCCGGRMTRKINSNQGNKRVYYYCRTGKKNGCDTPVMLKEPDLVDCVLQNTKAHIDKRNF